MIWRGYNINFTLLQRLDSQSGYNTPDFGVRENKKAAEMADAISSASRAGRVLSGNWLVYSSVMSI